MLYYTFKTYNKNTPLTVETDKASETLISLSSNLYQLNMKHINSGIYNSQMQKGCFCMQLNWINEQ